MKLGKGKRKLVRNSRGEIELVIIPDATKEQVERHFRRYKIGFPAPPRIIRPSENNNNNESSKPNGRR